MIWQLNNTSIRNPSRSKKLIEVYSQNGFIEGLFEIANTKAQIELYEACKNANAIKSNADSDENKAWWGRKIRLTLKEFGLISPIDTEEYAAGEITKTGLALANAESSFEILDILQRIIFNLETRKDNDKYTFRPIPLMINILFELGKETSSSEISRHEFALIIQNYKPNYEFSNYVKDIVTLRENLKDNEGKKLEFYKNKYEVFSREVGMATNTIKAEYPDVTFRVLILSQIFMSKGKGIMLNPQYEKLIPILKNDSTVCKNIESYYSKIMNLPSLPFDNNRDELFQVVSDNYKSLKERKVAGKNDLREPSLSMSTQELDKIRLKQNEIILKSNECAYADSQRHKTDIILKWFERLTNTKMKNYYHDDEYIGYEDGERPQYLEWIVWRAFLSINSLINKPYESRKFKIGPDFKPISHAPSRVPDLIFEFESFILVVEVTFQTSSRQVANENEPVRRHVAQVSDEFNKPVYGLLIAPEININTIDEFKKYDYYYLDDDTRADVNIIPLTISKFLEFFKDIEKANPDNPTKLVKIFENCFDNREMKIKKWQEYINEQFINIQRPK